MNQLYDIKSIPLLVKFGLSRNSKISKLSLKIIGDRELTDNDITNIQQLGGNQALYQVFLVATKQNKQHIIPTILKIRRFSTDSIFILL